MNAPKMTANCLKTLDNHFGKACYALGAEKNEDALVVLIRTMEEDPLATVEDLAAAWAIELDDPADADTINLVHCLHRLLGAEWHVVALHFYLLDLNDGCRDISDTRDSCPLYGDEVEEVEEYWQRAFDEFDSKRAKEGMERRLEALHLEMEVLNLRLAA
jgi:hypothetical protein